MGTSYLLSLDQGTTGTTASLVNDRGRLMDSVNVPFRQYFPKPSWVEHDAEEIWASVKKSLRLLKSKQPKAFRNLVAMGLTNQRETVVAWDRSTGKPLAPAIVWQCRRTTDMCKKLKKDAHWVEKRTGLFLDPYFSATKMAWLLKNNSQVKKARKAKRLCFGTIDSFLLYRLTQGKSYKTEASNASRTMLYDLKKKGWGEDLMSLFGVKSHELPEIQPSDAYFGSVQGVSELPQGLSIHGILGDQQSALFGQGAYGKGEAKVTFGTGSFLLFNTGKDLPTHASSVLNTVAWELSKGGVFYALEGGAFICGAAVQWLRDQMGLIPDSPSVEKLARQVQDSGGVDFVPALSGLGAPHWAPEARGTITGITRGTSKAHVARATLDSMALQNVEILQAMEKESKVRVRALKVDGGAAKNKLLMQLQSDYMGRKVYLPKYLETTSYGAALIAGLGAGVWGGLKELEGLNPVRREFAPCMTSRQRQQRLSQWGQAVSRATL